MEIYVDDEAKLTLHGLVQHYIMLDEVDKNRKLNDLLDALDFNQVLQFWMTSDLQRTHGAAHFNSVKYFFSGGNLRQVSASCY